MLEATCDCGAVRIEIPDVPHEINACPCAYCRRIGARWGYYRPASLSVTGDTQVYLRASKRIGFHRCASCGVVTHWAPLTRLERVGVQMANFDPETLRDVPVVVDP